MHSIPFLQNYENSSPDHMPPGDWLPFPLPRIMYTVYAEKDGFFYASLVTDSEDRAAMLAYGLQDDGCDTYIDLEYV